MKRFLAHVVFAALLAASLFAATPVFEHVASIHLGSRYQKIVERDGYWYLAGEWGLECWQFNAQDEFIKLSEVATPGIAQWVALEGNYAYVADGWEGLTIVDITDPNGLSFVSNYEPPHRQYPEMPSEVQYVSVRNEIVYATGTFGLSAIDVTNPLSPVETSRFAYADTVWGMPIDDGNRFGTSVITGNRLFVAVKGTPNLDKFSNGLYEFDISDPKQPKIVTVHLRDITVPEFVAIQDSVLLVASWWDLTAFTIEFDGSLRQRGILTDLLFHTGDPNDLAILGNTALIAGSSGVTQGGVTNIDISNLDTLTIREDFRLPTNFNCVQMIDSIGFAGYFHSDLLQIRLKPDGFLDSIGFIDTYTNIRGVGVKDDALYASSRNEGLIIFDVSDRANPVLLDRIPLGDPLRPIVLGNYLCVGNIEPLAAIFDISTPTLPQLIDTIHRDRIWTFAKLDDILFAPQLDSTFIFTLHDGELTHVKVSVPMSFREPIIHDSIAVGLGVICRIESDTTLTVLSHIGGAGVDFDVKGDHYFAAQGYGGLGVFDVSNPSVPIFLKSWIRFGHTGQPGDAASVRALGDFVFLFESELSITVIDVSNPSSPTPIDRIPTPGYALQGVLDSEYLYVADQFGIEILRHSRLTDTGDTAIILPRGFALNQNVPNPFRHKTRIDFTLSQPQEVQLKIYNILGQSVREFTMGRKPVGTFSVDWDGTDNYGREVASGVYFYQLSTHLYREHKKMLLLK